MKKRPNATPSGPAGHSRQAFQGGTYSLMLTAAVLALLIVLNLLVSALPTNLTQYDISASKLYSVTSNTKVVVNALEQDVTIYWIVQSGEEDAVIENLLGKYESLSDHITVVKKNPDVYPTFAEQYTDETVKNNSLVVECGDRYRYISYNDIYLTETNVYSYNYTTSFDGEGQLSSAVNYVTSDVQKKIYTVTGHGEGSLSTTITDLMTKNNYTTEELNLLMKDSIPDDCDLLLMDGPTNDLSDDEVSLLSGYLGEGGKVMCLLGDTGLDSLPKLAGLLKDYGIEGADGYIADPQRCYQNQPYYIFPVLNLSGDMADGISSQMVLLMNSRGLTTTDPARDTITTSAFMTTSEQAYAVTEEDQKQGTYDLGVVATETISSDSKESRLTVISAGSLIDQQITDAFSQLENTQVFMNAVTANFDGVTNLSIEAKSLTTEYNTVQHAGGFSILVVFGIPAVVLIGGFVVWFRRRKA